MNKESGMGRAKSMRDVQKESSKIFSQNLHSTNEITLNQSISIPKGRH